MNVWEWVITASLTAYGIGMITGKNMLKRPSGRRSGLPDRRKRKRGHEGSDRRSDPTRDPSKARWVFYIYASIMAVLIVVMALGMFVET